MYLLLRHTILVCRTSACFLANGTLAAIPRKFLETAQVVVAIVAVVVVVVLIIRIADAERQKKRKPQQ